MALTSETAYAYLLEALAEKNPGAFVPSVNPKEVALSNYEFLGVEKEGARTTFELMSETSETLHSTCWKILSGHSRKAYMMEIWGSEIDLYTLDYELDVEEGDISIIEETVARLQPTDMEKWLFDSLGLSDSAQIKLDVMYDSMVLPDFQNLAGTITPSGNTVLDVFKRCNLETNERHFGISIIAENKRIARVGYTSKDGKWDMTLMSFMELPVRTSEGWALKLVPVAPFKDSTELDTLKACLKPVHGSIEAIETIIASN